MQHTLYILELRYTQNEVFGSSCSKCSWTTFEPQRPDRCPKCDSDCFDPGPGCELPFDDAHCTSRHFTGSARELTDELQRLGLTAFDGARSFRDPRGSILENPATGVHLDASATITDDDVVDSERAATRINARLTHERHA